MVTTGYIYVTPSELTITTISIEKFVRFQYFGKLLCTYFVQLYAANQLLCLPDWLMANLPQRTSTHLWQNHLHHLYKILF